VKIPEFLTESDSAPGSFQTWRRGFRRAVRSFACFLGTWFGTTVMMA
jgi:hypothetical protein